MDGQAAEAKAISVDVNNDSSDLVAKNKFIQLSRIQSETETTNTECYYPNNKNSVIFRETTV